MWEVGWCAWVLALGLLISEVMWCVVGAEVVALGVGVVFVQFHGMLCDCYGCWFRLLEVAQRVFLLVSSIHGLAPRLHLVPFVVLFLVY